MAKINKETQLNPKQEKFCQVYTSEEEFFGNGVASYLEVYDIDKSKSNWYKTACNAASRMLGNVKVFTRINELLEKKGLNDQHIDKQLLFLVNQHQELSTKLGAIKEYNSLKNRITKKLDLTSGGKPIPLLQGINVSANNSATQATQPQEED